MRYIGREALDRLDAGVERLGHVAHGYGKVADLVLTVRKIGNLLAVLDAAADTDGRRRKPPERCRDGRGEQDRQEHVDHRRNPEDAQDCPAFGRHDLVDVPTLGGQHQHPEHRAETLHGNGHRHDLLALLADPDDGRGDAGQRIHHLGIDGAGAARLLPVDGQVGAPEQGGEELLDAVQHIRLVAVHRRQIVAEDLAPGIEVPGIEEKIGVPVIDASPGPGRRDQPSQHGCDALGIDREVEAVQLVGSRAEAFAGLQLQQLFGVDRNGIRLDGRRGGDGAGNDLALRHQAFDARLDEAVAELVQVENADHQHAKRGKVEKQDAAGQARKDVVAEKPLQPIVQPTDIGRQSCSRPPQNGRHLPELHFHHHGQYDPVRTYASRNR